MDLTKVNQDKVRAIKDIILPAIKANRIVNFTFIKKNGELRELRLARSKKLEATVNGGTPSATMSRKWTLNERGMMTVEELTNDHQYQFRTINLNTCVRIACNGQVYSFS